MRKITDWWERIRASHFSVKELAQKCNVSPQYLLRYIRQTTRLSVHEWMRRHRLRQALVLLAEGKSVKAIAKALAYTHVGNFSRDFRRFFNLSPRQFRAIAGSKIPGKSGFDLDNFFFYAGPGLGA